jgi:hypothetical protein
MMALAVNKARLRGESCRKWPLRKNALLPPRCNHNFVALKVALEAEDVDGGSPDGVGAGESVGGPLVGFVKALGAEVVDESEEVGVAQRERDEMSAGGRDERDADAEAPRMGIDIEGSELAVVGKVGLVGGSCSGEAVDDVTGEGDDGVGLEGIGVGEIVFFGAVLGAELIEIACGEDSCVAVLPGADVDARDGERVRRLSWTEEHFKSIAEGRWVVISG